MFASKIQLWYSRERPSQGLSNQPPTHQQKMLMGQRNIGAHGGHGVLGLFFGAPQALHERREVLEEAVDGLVPLHERLEVLVQVRLEAPVAALLQLPEPARLVPLLRAADLSTRLSEQLSTRGKNALFVSVSVNYISL